MGSKVGKTESSGKLRIGDDWNAITIIALSQSNPLKAVAEFVENSIDAGAKHITIWRGKEKGKTYLRIIDDGSGIPKDEGGVPNFKYVATHVCDSLKRQLKKQGEQGIQGEFGIGLLSFWTVGEELTMVCGGDDGRTYEMKMVKGNPNFSLRTRPRLIAPEGTQLTISPLLSGLRNFSGEKLQWYLASELRDRIRHSKVDIRIIDRQARAEYTVEPRQFVGQLINQLPDVSTEHGEIYTELYLNDASVENRVSLYRGGTRVVEDITDIEGLADSPWNSEYLQGLIDVPFLNLTPGTRLGVIQDERFNIFLESIAPLSEALGEILAELRKSEEEQTNQATLKTLQKAFREAILALPEEDYDWFEIRNRSKRGKPGSGSGAALEDANATAADSRQKQFFDHAGPLHSVMISPSSCVVPIGESRKLRAIARDRSRRAVDSDLTFQWKVIEGAGTLTDADSEFATFTAGNEPGLVKIRCDAKQDSINCGDVGQITVTDSILKDEPTDINKSPQTKEQRGLPSYTFHNVPAELWRSRMDKEQNVIIINKGHRDFVFASRNKSRKLRFICRLFVKELVFDNFPGYNANELLERMIELSLYAEENLR